MTIEINLFWVLFGFMLAEFVKWNYREWYPYKWKLKFYRLRWRLVGYPYNFTCRVPGCGFKANGTNEGFIQAIKATHIVIHKEHHP